MKINFIILILVGVICFANVNEVNASTFTSTDNLFSSSQASYLLDMAINQIDNFHTKKYVIVQVDNNYYLVSGSDVTINSNSITFTDSTIISAIRNSSGYQGYYTYNITNESSTTVNLSFIGISNIDTTNTVASTEFNDFQFKMNLVNIGIFILGLCFAIFVTKERRY